MVSTGAVPRTECTLLVPLYKTEQFTSALFERVTEIERELGHAIELVLVDDGCPKGSGIIAEKYARDIGRNVQIIYLARNFGSFQAITAGLNEVRTEFVVVMAADLQEPAEAIVDMFKVLKSGECDIVIGVRDGRRDPLGSKLAAMLFWGLYRRLVQKDVPKGGVDIFGCNAVVRQQISGLREVNSSLIGLLFWLGFRRQQVRYGRLKRQKGRSGWSFKRKVRYMMDSVFAFTDLPIRLLNWVGLWGLLASLIFAGVVAAARLLGMIEEVGYSALIVTILASTSAIIVAMSIIGSYVWRTYENSKGRPVFVIRAVKTLERGSVDLGDAKIPGAD